MRLFYFFNPVAMMENNQKTGKKVNIIIPIAIAMGAYFLFFFQTGLDMYRFGTAKLLELIILPFTGMAMGAVVTCLSSLIIWMTLHLCHKSKTFSQALFIIGYSYIGSLIFMVFGIVMNLIFQWNTSISTGVTGVLWSCGPVFASTRKLLNNHDFLAVIVASLCGILALAGWYVFFK